MSTKLRISSKFKSYVTNKQREEYINLYRQEFSDKDYLTFLRKCRGSLLFRGKSSLSYKLFDYIRKVFKKVITSKGEDPDEGLSHAISNLIPIIGTSSVKRGRKVQTIPVFLKIRKRIVLINKWLISSQKNKTNVRGIKIDKIARLLLMAMIKKGNVYDQKIDYVDKAFTLRYLLLRKNKKKS